MAFTEQDRDPHDDPVSSAEPTSPELRVFGILLPIRLGCIPGERDEPQGVEFDVAISFATPPIGMRTDQIDDTVSYVDIVDRIKGVIDGREFALIEHLGGEVFASLRTLVGDGDRLTLTVRKLTPPVPEITRGAEFVLSD